LQFKRFNWSNPYGEPVSVALLQGNVAQDQKWREEVRAATLEDYRRMALASDAQLIIFPETALPLFFDQIGPVIISRRAIATTATRPEITSRRIRAGATERLKS
jgi:apolipoprotein N-acyltransferase